MVFVEVSSRLLVLVVFVELEDVEDVVVIVGCGREVSGVGECC